MRTTTRTSRLLRDLRSLRVIVLHPNDQDGQEIIRQLQRIGCQVKAFWPPPEKLPEEVDLLFLAVRPEVLALNLAWIGADGTPPLIAVVNYENPITVEAVLQANANGVVASPVKSFGLLTAMVVARQIAAREAEKNKSIERLEQRIAGVRRMTKAKAILMQSRGIAEDEAYAIIREQAMSKRTTTEDIAAAIINANEILGYRPKPGVVRELELVRKPKQSSE